jgi:2-dehydropantoate 2-reductase
MRVLIVGAGAVGGYFGGRMQENGCDVTFLVRPRRREQLKADGLNLKSPADDLHLDVKTVLASEIDRPWDLILLSCKAYDLDSAMDSMAPAVGPQSMVLPLLNGMAHLDRLEQRFGADAILGGLCSIAATVDEQGTVRHMTPMHNLAFGERKGGDSPRVQAVAAMLKGVKFDWRLSSDIILEMWEKWVFLAALAATTCLMRASIGDILEAGGIDFINAALADTQAVAGACGRAARAEVLDKTGAMLIAPGSPLTASMLRDVERHGAIEADHIIGDLLRRGHASGLALPVLELAYRHLKAYEARRRREWAPT